MNINIEERGTSSVRDLRIKQWVLWEQCSDELLRPIRVVGGHDGESVVVECVECASIVGR